MSEDKPPSSEPEPGLDPRTWVRPRPEEPAVETRRPTSTSFDPATWRRDGESTDAPAPPPARRRLLVGLAAGGVLLGAAGGAVMTRRKDESGAADPGGALEARSTVAAPDVSQVADILRASGVQDEQASAAGTRLLEALGRDRRALQLTLVTRSAAGVVRLQLLEARHSDGAGARLTAEGAGFRLEVLRSELAKRTRVARGEMGEETFYAAAVSAGVPDRLITPFAQAFAFDFDFQREINPGDQFEAVYEEDVTADGRPQGEPRLLYVALTARVRSRAFYRFQPPADDLGWYSADGVSAQRQLMRTPVEGARVTSTFGPRLHPVLGYTRVHKGIDFGVPVGTAVFAAAAGVVETAGPHGGHGNYVLLRHNNGLSTAYAHLSQFSVAQGQNVRQGQEVAKSGNTGTSTGPHLHYEVYRANEAVDPLSFEMGEAQRLSGDVLAAFLARKNEIDKARSTAL